MRMPRAFRAAAVVGAAVAAAGAVEANADAARGLALSERWCSECHGIRPGQPSILPKAPSFSEIATEPSATEMSLRVFLQTPHPSMPNFILERDDIDDIVSYIVSLKR